MLRKIGTILEMIKFEHTIFALPFALISAIVAFNFVGFHSVRIIGWILGAMVGARSAAMGFNRIADAKIDAANPRTASRAIPKGEVSIAAAALFVAASAVLLIVSAYMLNPLAFALSPVALLAVLSYSYTKRFTSLSHLWLGMCLGIAPVGAWIAVTGQIEFAPMVLSAAVMFWTAGFDIIYSLQDVDFDKKMGLFSLPSRLGTGRALAISRLFHACMVGLLAWFGILAGLGAVYFVGVVLIGVFLAYEQSLVSPNDLSRLNTAFFTLNGVVSILLLAFVAVDVFL